MIDSKLREVLNAMMDKECGACPTKYETGALDEAIAEIKKVLVSGLLKEFDKEYKQYEGASMHFKSGWFAARLAISTCLKAIKEKFK